MIFSALINNITLIISLSILYRFIVRRWKYGSRTGQAISGFLFGAVAVVGMMNPLIISPGLIFDGRSIIISIAGFIGGWITALIAALMGIIYRTWLGGPGGIMGVSVIASSAAIGIAYHYIRRRSPHVIAPLHLIGFGIIVHTCMLALTMTLPSDMKYKVLSNIAIPVILIYPLGTLLVGIVLLELESRIRTEDALRESEEKYRMIIENIEDGYHEVDIKGNFTFVNESICKMIGYEREELLGMNNRPYADKENARKVYQTYKQVYLTGKPVKNFEWQIIRKDGVRRDVEVSISLIRDSEGQPTGFRGIARDITDRRRAEEEKRILEERLQHADKMEAIGTLAGGIAHDFNNLLMGIQGYASLTLLDLDPSDPHYERLKRIEEQVQSGADLTKQLLGFARGGRYEVKPADMNDILEKSSAMFGRTKKEISIHRKYGKDLCTVEVDRGQMEQAFMNLYVNAWQAMPGGGEIYLETENVLFDNVQAISYSVTPGKYVKISITDTGTGMDEKTRERIFDPFFTTKKMGRGTGLGLATVYGIIKGHKGMITVYSEPGHGTTFNIYLPASEKEVVKEKTATGTIARGTETILLVDDEKMVLEVSRKLLEFLGYRVYTAGSGQEAIAVYMEKRNKIDMVILDMIMPGISGGETFARLREINPEAKVLLSSGYSINGEAKTIMDRGCNGFIQKPFQLEKLSGKVRNMLD
ncbi:MAG: hypothetical protein AUK26_06980 [Syntrophaceae bacterium CG2_30_58_14]|nr:MAG: hypothetical protein AUK26_06980 [Syntrophaceae bacterium CG2_30_58_14]